MKQDKPEIGLHFDVPEAAYRAWKAINRSLLDPICAGQTLAHAREAQLHPKEPTPSLVLGTRCHHAILEPHLFEKYYAAWPGDDRRTKEGKQKWKEFEIANKGKEIIGLPDWETCTEMRDAAWKQPVVQGLLGGDRYIEVCAVWEDPETGVLCKCRVDFITQADGWTVLGDLKTTGDASAEAFAKSVANYGYYRQAAFYLDGFNALDERERLFVFLPIEKERPYLAARYDLPPEWIAKGRREYRDALRQWAEAEETGIWPGYPSEMRTLEPPRWHLSYTEEEIG